MNASTSNRPRSPLRAILDTPRRAVAAVALAALFFVGIAATAVLLLEAPTAPAESSDSALSAALANWKQAADAGVHGEHPTVGSGEVRVHPLGLFSAHVGDADPFPFRATDAKLDRSTNEATPAWWERPAPLTEREIKYQRFLSAVTWRLPRERWDPLWDVGGDQLGIYSVRFYAGFIGYAAAAFGMRTPAYPGLTKRIMLSATEHMLDKRAWSYIQYLWEDQPWFPDPVGDENIMYSGHVLQLMAMYEAITGDDRFRTQGFDFVWDEQTSFHYTLDSLAALTASQMERNPSGGVACEPDHVFFNCNNHPHVALRILDRLGLGRFDHVADKWERFILSSFYDTEGQGAIKAVYHRKKKKFFPIGSPGLDGWGLLWYQPWAADPDTPKSIWRIARNRIEWKLLERRRDPRGALRGTADFVTYLARVVWRIVPAVPSATFLYPAAAACEDPKAAETLRRLIENKFYYEREGAAFLRVGHKYLLGSTANVATGHAIENGSNMRHFVQRPLPREYFEGPLIDDITPPETTVYQAYRDPSDAIVLEYDSTEEISLDLRNVARVEAVEGLAADQWSFADGSLLLKVPGRHTVRIVI